MRKGRGVLPRIAIVSLAVWFALSTALSAASAVEGPWIGVTSHEDGQFVTTRDILVEGNATAPPRTILLGEEVLSNGTMTNVEWLNGNLTFRQKALFRDEFNGAALDMTKWDILADPGNVSVDRGRLKLNYTWAWPNPPYHYPLVKSKAFEVPNGTDLLAEFKMSYSSIGYSAACGGISKGSTDAYKSHLAVENMYILNPYSFYRVLANGQAVLNKTTVDYSDHVYTLERSADDGRYTCYIDGELLATFGTESAPTTFWFGPGPEGAYPTRSPILVDYVEIWALSGEWVSDPVEIGHQVVLDGVGTDWTSTNPRKADIDLSVRASDDLENWTDWVPLEDGIPLTPVAGSNLQVKARLSLPDLRKASARIRIASISLDYHDPLVSVEVRRQGGEWVTAEGLEEWRATLTLLEDGNVVEVRVTDTGGAVNTTALALVVDTTPPTGTMEIAGKVGYTNDPNVTLLLSATDRYGVEWVEVSNRADFSKRVRVPYTEELHWVIPGAEGENTVHVRFVDAHGLLSAPVADSILFDSFPPHGSVTIDGGGRYTPSYLVQLELAYSDNRRVSLVELSNDPWFTEPWEVPGGVTTIANWSLAGGGDGTREVFLRVTDVAGNTIVASDDIELYIPKPLGSVTIDEGARLTGETVVALAIDIPYSAQVHLMQVANEPDFEGAAWEALSRERMWILSPGDGTRTVYVRFVDFRDIVSLPINDSILLDTSPPLVNLTLDDGAVYTTDATVAVAVAYEDASDPVRMWVSGDDTFYRVQPRDWEEEFDWDVPARESDHRVFVRVEDAAGNLGVGSAVIHYATHRPVIRLSLPEGDVTRARDTIPLEVIPTDYYGGIEVQVAWDQDPGDGAPWSPLDGLVDVPVPEGAGDGPHQIRVRARNAAGLMSNVTAIQVTLDTVPPLLNILHPVDGSIIPQRGLVVLLRLDASDATLIERVAYAVDGGDLQDLPGDALLVNVTLDDFGDHTIEVVVEDAAGNVARSNTTFTLEDSDTVQVSVGRGVLILIILTVLAATGVAAWGRWRTRRPGLRSARVHPGDGWEDEWTRSDDGGEAGEREGEGEGAGTGTGTGIGTGPEDAPPEDLEDVQVPGEAGPPGEGVVGSHDADEWQEF